MAHKHKRIMNKMEMRASQFTEWVGSPSSILVHTILFVFAFCFIFFGTALDTILLVLTTVVSLEAIYLALFIQMSVNRNTQSLAEVEEDIEDIAEGVDEIEKDIDEIEKDIDEMQEDVEEMEHDIDKWDKEDEKDRMHDVATISTLDKLQQDIGQLMADIQVLKDQKKE